MKKTAVEWLVDQMKQRENQGLTLSMYELEMFGEKAKEMEKEQIKNAFEHVDFNLDDGLHYYEQTFKSFCPCDDGIIVCPGCNGEQSKFGMCAGCHGEGKVVCGKCGGKNNKSI